MTLDKVTAHVANPDLIGHLVNDRSLVVNTSGTSGTRGIFVLDERYVPWLLRWCLPILRRGLTVNDLAEIIAHRGQFAQLM